MRFGLKPLPVSFNVLPAHTHDIERFCKHWTFCFPSLFFFSHMSFSSVSVTHSHLEFTALADNSSSSFCPSADHVETAAFPQTQGQQGREP